MNNKFINNNGVNLLHTSKKPVKTKVESQIEMLKQQEQEISQELWVWETKFKKAERLTNYLEEVNSFSTKHLAEAVEKEKNKDDLDIYWLEHLIKNRVEFALKFKPISEAFYQLVCQKIANQVSILKRKLADCQSQFIHQERLFARLEIRRQGRELLTCEYKNRLGCLGVYQCDNCKANYSVADNNQAAEMRSIPGGQITK